MPAAHPSDLPPPANHVFVDFENVHDVDLSVIGAKSVNFTLLLGARNSKLDTALVENLVKHAASVKLVRLKSIAKNALDFALSYYLGRAVLADPTAYFHIVSGDKGFDPLIEHLRNRHINVRRHDDFSTLTFSGPRAAKKAPADDLYGRVLEGLRKDPKNHPHDKKALINRLRTLAGGSTTLAEAAALCDRLVEDRHITIGDKDAVSCHL